MSNTIFTDAGRALIAACLANGETLGITEMIFADVPGLDPAVPPDPAAPAPPAAAIVHRAVPIAGLHDSTTVIYSTVITGEVGDFYLNYMGLLAGDVLVAACATPRHIKFKSSEFKAGNTLIKNFALAMRNASDLTGITIPAESWMWNIAGGYAPLDHNHDDRYALKEHEHGNVAGKSMFEIFYSLSPETPPGAFPLWTGETILNCRNLFPDFWDKAVELAESGEQVSRLSVITAPGDQLPIFTSNTGNGFTLSGSGSTTGTRIAANSVYKVFSSLGNHALGTNLAAGREFVFLIEFPNAENNIGSYAVNAGTSVTSYPTAWVLEGSNDQIEWDLIDRQSDQVFSAAREGKTFAVVPTPPVPCSDARRLALENLAGLTAESWTFSYASGDPAAYSAPLTFIDEELSIPANFQVFLLGAEEEEIELPELELGISGGNLTFDRGELEYGTYIVRRADIARARELLAAINKTGITGQAAGQPYRYFRLRFLEGSKPTSGTTVGLVTFSPAKVDVIAYEHGLLRAVPPEVYRRELETYGETGAFVLDRENGHLRLPCIRRFIRSIEEAAEIGATEPDRIVNITGYVGAVNQYSGDKNAGAFATDPTWQSQVESGTGGGAFRFASFDASRVVETGDEVQPRHVAAALYIQVYSAAVPASIAQAAELLGLLADKANRDFSNLSMPAALQNLGFAGSFGSSGYQKLPGGLILQWGLTGQLANNSRTALSFPVAFKSACLGVCTSVAQWNSPHATLSDLRGDVDLVTPTGFTLFANDVGGGTQATSFYFFAIGC